MEEHRSRTQALAQHVKHFYGRKQGFRVFHGGSTSTRRMVYNAATSINTSSFNHVLFVDKAALLALVEPNVNMDKLVDATLPHGLVPAVVPEFSSITVGGAFAGTAGESSSFRYGLLEDTVSRIEIILANGAIVNASHEERADLFHGSASAFGTLGVLTMLAVRLVPAKRYVHITLYPVRSSTAAVEQIDNLTRDESVDYVDGIMYTHSSGVIMAGSLAEDVPLSHKGVTFSRRKDPWFYMYIEKHLKLLESATQHCVRSQNISPSGSSLELDSKSFTTSDHHFVPLKDYLFRYDRAAFWTAAWAFKYCYIQNWAFQRWLLDSIVTTPKMLHAFNKSGLANQYIVQDIAVPYDHTPEFMETVDGQTGIWPLWLCPLKQGQSWPLRPTDERVPDRLMNVGIWGPGSRDLGKFVEQNKHLETRAKELHGIKCLYAQVYSSEDEFWQMYDKESYESLRRKYDAGTLPTVYDKVGKNSAIEEMHKREGSKAEYYKGKAKDFWIFRGVYGAACMIIQGGPQMKRR